jgi:hypothetical protein
MLDRWVPVIHASCGGPSIAVRQHHPSSSVVRQLVCACLSAGNDLIAPCRRTNNDSIFGAYLQLFTIIYNYLQLFTIIYNYLQLFTVNFWNPTLRINGRPLAADRVSIH